MAAWQITLGEFFQSPRLHNRLARMPKMQVKLSRALLHGPERCGKTSLLFQYAFHLACKGQQVLFLCDQSNLDQSPPLLPIHVQPDHDALRHIQFKYVHDLHHLKNFGACLHLMQALPAAIIIDNLSLLVKNTRLSDKQAQDTALTKALAFILDALGQLREHGGVDVLLLVCDSSGRVDSNGREGVPQHLYLLQRLFPLILSLSGAAGPGNIYSLQASL